MASPNYDNEGDHSGYVFLPGKEEALLGRMRLRYSSVSNTYFQGTNEELKNRPKAIGTSLTQLAYDFDNVERITNDVTNEVYIDRQDKQRNGRITWKFNFAPCGLVLDRLTMKMSFQEANGGQVIVSVSGDTGAKSAVYCSPDVYMTITRLEGSSTLFLTANLTSENKEEITRIATEYSDDEHQQLDYPFDLQIRLKRPDFTIGRSLIFLGLMYSQKEPQIPYKNKNTRKRSKTSKEEATSTQGYLNILIHKAKRLPCRENGAYAEPKVKCTIYGNGPSQKVKTRAIGKALNPTWNERLVFTNINQEKLPYSQLELQVVHSKSMFKLKSSETLGYSVLQRQNVAGTWRKPVCRNHSIKRPSLLNVSSSNKKISSVSHHYFASTEDLTKVTESSNNTKEIQTETQLLTEEEITKDVKTLESQFEVNDITKDTNTTHNLTKNIVTESSLVTTNNIFKSKLENQNDGDETVNQRANNDATNDTRVNSNKSTEIESKNKKTIKVYDLPMLKESNIDDDPQSDSRTGKHEDNDLTNIDTSSVENNLNEGQTAKSAFPSIGHADMHLNNTSFESDIVNITFRDKHVKRLLDDHQTEAEVDETRTSSYSSEDESFEILPSFNYDERHHSPMKDVVNIENTVDESCTDGADKSLVSTDIETKNKNDSPSITKSSTSTNEARVSGIKTRSNTASPSITDIDKPVVSDIEIKVNNQAISPTDMEPQRYESLSYRNRANTLPIDLGESSSANTNEEAEDSDETMPEPSVDLSGTIEEEIDLNSKRRAISVDNSQLTPSRTRRFGVNNNKQTNKSNSHEKLKIKRSHSLNDLLDINKKRVRKFNKKKGFSSKLYRSGSVSNILDDFFEEKTKVLSHEHWSMVISSPEKWFYCWHPLLGVNNLLSGWQ